MNRSPLTVPKEPTIAVYLEFPDGELDESGRGILSDASRLARTLGFTWIAVTVDQPLEKSVAELGRYGLAKLVTITTPAGTKESLEELGAFCAGACEALNVSLVLFAHNDQGEILAPRVAAALAGALFTETIAYERGEEGLTLSRLLVGVRLAESLCWTGKEPLVMTKHRKTLSPVLLPNTRAVTTQCTEWKAAPLPAPGGSKVVKRLPPDPQTVDLSEAEVIISAGMGCSPQRVEQIKELAKLVGASLGATRPVYDRGDVAFPRMVGQTGKSVAPRFYLALGISGSMHHIGGIKDSGRIVSVNIDGKAPIFPNSDEGFVADVDAVLPLLLSKIRSRVEGRS